MSLSSRTLLIAVLLVVLLSSALYVVLNRQPSNERTEPRTDRVVTPQEPAATDHSGDLAPVDPVAVPVAGAHDLGLSGVVVDAFSGEPISTAELRLTREYGPRDIDLTTVSRQDGSFAFPPGFLRRLTGCVLRVTHPQYIHRSYRMSEAWPERIALSRGRSVSGRVVGPDGKGVGNAEVTLIERVSEEPIQSDDDLARGLECRYQGETQGTFRSDSAGAFTVAVGSRRVGFQARADGYGPGASEIIDVESPAARGVLIRLGTASTLRGRVVDADGAAVANASIRVTARPEAHDPDQNYSRFAQPWQAYSSAEGNFELAGLTSSVYLYVESPQHERYRESEWVSTEQFQTIVLQPARWIVGRLIVDDDESGISRGSESWSDLKDSAGLSRSDVSITVESDGRFKSDPIRPRITSDELVVPGYVPVAVSWKGGTGPYDVGELHLTRGQQLSVVVVDDTGQPLPGTRVVTSNDTSKNRNEPRGCVAITDELGAATLTGIAGAQVRLFVRRHGFDRVDTILALDELTQPHSISLMRSAVVQGRVMTPSGEPAFGAHVGVSGADLRDLVDVDANGRFLCESVLAGEAFELEAARDGITGALTLEPLSPAEVRDVGEIVIASEYWIRGVVEDEQGERVAAARVRVSAGLGSSSFWVECDDDGSFEIPGSPGRLTLQGVADGCMSERYPTVTIKESDVNDVVLKVIRGTPFEGRVVDLAGIPVVGARVAINPQSRMGYGSGDILSTDETGSFRHPRAPRSAGRISIEHDLYGDWEKRFDSLDELPETFTLTPRTGLLVRFVPPPGEPVPIQGSLRLRGRGRSSNMSGMLDNGVKRSGDMEPGSYEFTASTPGYPSTEPQQVTLRQGEMLEITVQLPTKPEPVDVLVVDSQGHPIAGASVTVYEVVGGSASGKGIGQTGADGVLRCEESFGASSTVFVMAQGCAPGGVESAVDHVRDGVLRVELVPQSVIEVSARDADGRPLQDATITADAKSSTGLSRFGGRRRGVALDEDGRARVEGLAAEEYWVELRRGRDRLARKSVVLGIAERGTVEFELQPQFPVRIQVVINGEVAESGQVVLARQGNNVSAELNEGIFAAALMETGTYDVRYRDGDLRHSERVRIDGEREIVISMATVSVSGLVLDVDGEPVAGVRGYLGQSFETDDAGRFELARVVSGTYSWSFYRPPVGVFAPSPEVEITEPVELVYQFQPGRLLRVIHNGPEQVPSTEISVRVLHPNGRSERVPPAEEGGVFVWPMTGTVGVVTARGYGEVPIVVSPEQADVAVSLLRGARVSVELAVEGDREVRLQSLTDVPWPEALSLRRTVQGGVSWQLPPGHYRVATEVAGQGVVERTFEVIAGNDVQLQLP